MTTKNGDAVTVGYSVEEFKRMFAESWPAHQARREPGMAGLQEAGAMVGLLMEIMVRNNLKLAQDVQALVNASKHET